MALRSSLFSVAATAAFDASGYLLDAAGRVIPGYVRVTRADLPLPASGSTPARHVVHAAPGRPVLESIRVPGTPAVDGGKGAWKPAQMKAAYPAQYDGIMERVVYNATTGERRRLKRMEPTPTGFVVETDDLLPHLWLGEDPS